MTTLLSKRVPRQMKACVMLCVLFLSSIFAPQNAWATITGSGTETSPYTINNSADLDQFKQYVESGNSTYVAVSKYWKVTADFTWTTPDRIGYVNYPFYGIFDGNGHTITFSSIKHYTVNEIGFFGVTQDATIKNLTLVYSALEGNDHTGGLVGEVKGGTLIENIKIRVNATGAYSSTGGNAWGGLVGHIINISGKTVEIKSSSVVFATVNLNRANNYDSGGLVGFIDGDGGTVKITDCISVIGFNTASNKNRLGGLIGTITANTNVTMTRCYTPSTIPGLPSYGSSTNPYERGSIIGYINGGTLTCNSVYTNNAIWYGGTYNSSAFIGNNINVYTSWLGNSNVFDYLERANDNGGTLSTTTRGNEKWGFDVSVHPMVNNAVDAYAVRVTKGSNIGNITGYRYQNGSYYYLNANETLTVPASSAPTVHQRVEYSFVKDYDPSTGVPYTAAQNGNNWNLTARVNGTVNAQIINIPYPTSPTSTFDQWNSKVTINWNYDNPNNLTGKFYVYRLQTTPASGSWTLIDAAGTSIVNGTGKSISISQTLTASDFGKIFDYRIAFVEGTGAAPTSPVDINVNNTATISVNTTPSIGTWSVTATGGSNSIDVTFTADQRLTNSASYKYTIQRSVNGGAFADLQANQNFTGATSYTYTDNTPTTTCDVYQYRVNIAAFNTTFTQTSNTARITGSTKFLTANPFKASKGEYANYVRLQWNVNKLAGGATETYRVFRRVANTSDPFIVLETVTSNAATVYWSDNNALTGVYYEYKVTLYQVCTGTETELESKTDVGFTQSFGTVSGRVTYGTGNAVENANMLVRRNDLQQGESQYHSLKSTGGGQKFEWLSDAAYFNNIWTSKQWTLQFWVYPEVTNTGTTIIGYLGNKAINLIAVTGGYQIATDFGTSYRSEINPNNKFSHIVITRNNNDMRIYTVCDQNKDSIYIKNTAFIFTDATALNTADCKINFGLALNGNIDDVRFWNRSLSETEIMRDYSRRLVGNESGLKGYWTFDESLLGYAFDMSRVGTVYNGNHATTQQLAFDDKVPDGTYQLAIKGITDANGNYQISGIPFVGEGTSYSIVPTLGVHVFNPTEQLRYISPTSMVNNGTDFTDISAFNVSGVVTYDGGTYPVADCSFEIDDKPVTQSNGAVVKSDYSGNFTISVPIGVHKVRIVKQGHTFANNGLLLNASSNINYNAPLNNIKFFDQTRVKLIGRVAGGAIENGKTLGFGESNNNIGVQTITLDNTRPQYNFVNTTKPETVYHNQGQWKKPGGLADDYTITTFNPQNITIQVSKITGEFVAMVYPEPYNIHSIVVPAASGTFTIYGNNEMIDLTSSAVPDNSMLQTSVRTWKDSTFVANQPGVVDHWQYSDKSDTVFYNAKWTYYYQATPTFGVKQLVNAQPVNYFGEKTYILTDNLTGVNDTLSLWNQTSGYLFGKPVFKQGVNYVFHFNAYEEYTNYVSTPAVTKRYPVTNGTVNMTNNVMVTPQPENISMDANGEADYSFMAGAPNLTTGTNNFYATLSLGSGNYYWNISTDLAPTNTVPVVVWHLGDRTTGTDFMTAGPNQITAILRDPPGNHSKSFIEQGTTISLVSSISTGIGINTNTNLTTSLGPKIVSFVGIGGGVISENDTKLDVSAGFKTETKLTAGLNASYTTTFTERFETSDDPAFVGRSGDVFIGNSTNLLYGLTNGISIQKNYQNTFITGGNPLLTQGAYSIAPSVSLAYGQSFDTRFAFTQSDIEQIMIPKWKNALSMLLKPVGTTVNTAVITNPVYVSKLLPTDPNFGKLNTDQTAFGAAASIPDNFDDGPSYTIYYPANYHMLLDSVMYFNNQIEGWTATLAQNEKEKVEMEKLGNYSFGSGTNIQYSKNSSASLGTTLTFHTMISSSLGLTTGTKVVGIGLELAASVEMVRDIDISAGVTAGTSISSGFTLQDNSGGSQITVDYGMTSSGTMAFKTRGGRTSCPYEDAAITKYYQPGTVLDEATMQIEVPKISVTSSPQVINVPSNRSATYTLALQNESQTGANNSYELVVGENTNPNGAVLYIDGTPIGNGRIFYVQSGQTLQKTLTLSKGTTDNYQNIAIILRSQCQDDIADTAYVSANFIPACSDIAITSPQNNWILNADSQTGDTLNITLANYDVNFPNFGYIKLEYRPVSSPNWNTIATFYPSALYPNAQGTKEDIGNRATIVYPWKTPQADGAYELRATTASVNIVNNTIMGDPLSTFTTDAVAGYKDVTRPRSLGAPSPANGILGIGDELSITFNEDIQTGMLTNNNFTISGVLNAQTIAEPNVGLAFTGGTQAAQTELPIFTNGSFSIETWFKRDVNTAGTLFAFGANDNYISLGFNTAGKAVLKLGSETYTSVTAVVNDDTWKYIAMAYDRENNTVAVYEYEGATNNILFTAQPLTASPETQGKLIVGNNAAMNDGFHGAVSQLHFYGINREQAAVASDKSVTKSGREYGLIGYWVMDEGAGTVAVDKARARNLVMNADWYIYPSGYAKQTNNNYFSVLTSTYPLNAFCDFTLEFWFRSANNNQYNQTIFSADNGSIGTNASGGLTLYKKDGTVNQVLTANNLTNTKWHHIALSIRRGGSANVYIDGVSTAVFAENLLGTFASGNYYFGAKYTAPNTYNQYFAGYFDEIRIWNSALNSASILLNKNSKLRGDEPGLQAYYPFEIYTKQPNGLITVTTTNSNIADNNVAAGTATGFSTTAMAVKDVRQVEDVPYTFVASNNKIVFTLDNNYFARVEGATLTVTVNDVRDMHNNLSNTEQWTAYVKRNPLVWDSDPVNLTMEAGANRTFTAKIVNTGGATVSYSIENLPSWLTVSSSTGNLAPLANKELTFTVYQGTNIGNYETAVGLTSGNGVTDILPVQLKVTGQRPDWSVNPSNFESSMNITGRIKISGVFQEDKDDILAAFIGNLCVGVTSPIYVEANNAYFTFANIYGNAQQNNQPLTFKLWDASTGRIYPQIETSTANIRFAPSQIVGNISNPVIFNALNIAEQTIALNNGWTWISTNVLNNNPSILNQMKTSLAAVGVLIKGRDAYVQQPGWSGNLTEISAKSMYIVNTNADYSLVLEGQYADAATTPITINQGWNWIGYIPAFTLPIKNALAGINAQIDDHIKGQNGYAVYAGGASGWIGSLNYMEAGKGYMYYSGNANAQTLIYPSAASQMLYAPALRSADAVTPKWTVDISHFSNTMVLTGIVVNDNVAMQSDQIEVAAFSGNECRGSAMLQYEANLGKYIAYLMIYGDGNEMITLKVFDHAANTEYTANNAPIRFTVDAIYGNPEAPYIIGLGTTETGTDNVNLTQVNVYPNPVKYELKIMNYELRIMNVEILDITGKIIYNSSFIINNSINVSALASGVYFIKITTDNGMVTRKFIKE